MTGNAIDLCRLLKAQRLQCRFAVMQTKAHPGVAVVGQLGLGEHGVLFQVGQLRIKQLTGHGQQETVGRRQDAKARLHAAFDHATSTQAAGTVVEVADVAGQLALQKFAGVRAADGENAFVGQGAEKSGIGHGSSQGSKTGGHDRAPSAK
ncbi:hypothetical protein D3C78_1252250 [compost metagenome]